MSCPIKDNSNTIELTLHTSCYSVLINWKTKIFRTIRIEILQPNHPFISKIRKPPNKSLSSALNFMRAPKICWFNLLRKFCSFNIDVQFWPFKFYYLDECTDQVQDTQSGQISNWGVGVPRFKSRQGTNILTNRDYMQKFELLWRGLISLFGAKITWLG